jgi:hypothetical protein
MSNQHVVVIGNRHADHFGIGMDLVVRCQVRTALASDFATVSGRMVKSDHHVVVSPFQRTLVRVPPVPFVPQWMKIHTKSHISELGMGQSVCFIEELCASDEHFFVEKLCRIQGTMASNQCSSLQNLLALNGSVASKMIRPSKAFVPLNMYAPF